MSKERPISKHYDVSGADGRHGMNGLDAPPHGGISGQSGAKGGDGTEGTAGQPGGSLRLRLFDPAGYGHAHRETLGVAGNMVHADGSSEEADDRLRVTREPVVFGDAHGGDGGNGGNGGRGGRGARGSSGSDASRYSSAGDGGRGGRGGMGGKAANGQNPGAGGHVVFLVDSRDTDLVSKTGYNIKPGKIGRAGTPGQGGPGGRGGPGGSGCSWTESYTTTENGKTVRKTRRRSRPSGSRGSAGATGPSNQMKAYHGLKQPPGTFTIVVTDAEGQPLNEYHAVYDLELLGFELRSRNLDGVFEPDEEILATNLRLRNRSGKGRMPTPPGFRIRFYFKPEAYLEGDGGELEMRKTLQAGEERTLAGPLAVNLRDLDDAEIPQVGEAWGAQQVVNPSAELESVRHEFDNFKAPQTIHLRFPIEVTPISSAYSMARGERKKILWRVRNVSRRDFGARTEIRRDIAMLIRRAGGSLAEEHLTFSKPDGPTVALDTAGFLEKIEHLPPYDGTPATEARIEGHLEIGDEAPFYEEAVLRLDLSLGRIGAPTELRRIQGRAHRVRIAQAYRKTHGSEVLLVTNSGSSRPEVEAWRELAATFGMALDIWDLSYNKGFDLSDERSSRVRLVHDFRGRTVVFLNHAFEVAAGESAAARSVAADAFLDPSTSLEAVTGSTMSFVLVGNAERGGAHVLRELMLPPKRKQRGLQRAWPSPKHFLRDLRAQARGAQDIPGLWSETGDLDMPVYITAQRRGYGFFFKPKAKHLDSIARKLLTRLDRLFPTRRYRVTPRYRPERGKRYWWNGEYNLGEIELTRSLDRTVRDTAGTLTALDAGEEMHTRDFVLRRATTGAFLRSLKPRQKLEAFAHLFRRREKKPGSNGGREVREALIDAILADVAAEQAALRRHWGGGFSKKRLRARMNYLRTLAEEYDFGPTPPPGSEKADLLVRLIAGLEHLGRSQRLWRDIFYRTVVFLLPLIVAGVAVFFGLEHLAQFENYLLQRPFEVTAESVRIPGLSYGFAPEIYGFLPALLAPVLSWFSLRLLRRRNHQVSSLTAHWARHLHRRLFPQNDADRGSVHNTWRQVKERVQSLHVAVTARLGNRRDRRRESMRQMLSPFAAVTTANELDVEPEERFFSAEVLDSSRAESARRAAAKKTLEADLHRADQALSLLVDRP